MKSMLKLIAAAVIGAAALTACGGHYKAPEAVVVVQPEYKQTDTVVGTGTAAQAGTVVTVYDPADAALPVADRTILISYPIDSQLVTVSFSGYLYDGTKADGKGALFETSTPGESTSVIQPFTVGVGRPIAGSTNLIGLDQAVLGVKLADGSQVPMKVGGKRTVVLPASLAYGPGSLPARTLANGKSFAALPANSPMVYDIELVAISKIPNIVPETPPTVVTDLVAPVVGTGAVPVAGKFARVFYTGYLYDGTRANRIGTQFDTNVPVVAPTPPATATPFSFLVDASPTLEVIKGFNDTVKDMRVGGKRTVIIPGKLAYGKTGNSTIPPNTSLVFTIEVVDVVDVRP